MVETGCFDYLKTSHVVAPEALPALEQLRSNRRVIDEVAVSPDAPEEYGSILDNAGTGIKISRKNASLMRDLCSRISTAPGRPVVLKNPWDCANFLPIKELFPEARFIFIQRHPERVIHSNLNATRKLLDAKDEYYALILQRYNLLFSGRPLQCALLSMSRLVMSRRRKTGVRVATALFAASAQYMVENIDRIPPSDYLSIRYEDLCAKPDQFVTSILEFARLDRSAAKYPETRPAPRQADLLPEVKWYRDVIRKKTAPYMMKYGYT